METDQWWKAAVDPEYAHVAADLERATSERDQLRVILANTIAALYPQTSLVAEDIVAPEAFEELPTIVRALVSEKRHLASVIDIIANAGTRYRRVAQHVANCGGTCADCRHLARLALDDEDLP